MWNVCRGFDHRLSVIGRVSQQREARGRRRRGWPLRGRGRERDKEGLRETGNRFQRVREAGRAEGGRKKRKEGNRDEGARNAPGRSVATCHLVAIVKGEGVVECGRARARLFSPLVSVRLHPRGLSLLLFRSLFLSFLLSPPQFPSSTFLVVVFAALALLPPLPAPSPSPRLPGRLF